MELTLDSPVRFVPRVGPAMAKRLENLEIFTAGDLLLHVAFRYNDYSRTVPISSVRPGETVTISGTISKITNIFTKTGKKMQRGSITDQSGSISVIWFNQLFLSRVFMPGDKVNLAGKADWFGRDIVMLSPEYEIIVSDTSLHTGRLVPVYPETQGVSSKWMRGRIAFLLDCLEDTFVEHLPESLRTRYTLVGFRKALWDVHFPKDQPSAAKAKERLAFDELLFWQLRARLDKRAWESTMSTKPMVEGSGTIVSAISNLPFTLTQDQKHAISEITSDLSKTIPMNRLLVGDVGSGKTVVAALAMYIALRNGASSLLMAPTQILAQQHFQTIASLVSAIGLDAHLITGSVKSKGVGGVGVYIGTHALLGASGAIPNIGLVIIDEQHRFGVGQRSELTKVNESGLTPHLLTMTATPIPRTMAKVLFSNIDLSVLSSLPGGRKKVKTWVTPKEKREKAYVWIQEQIKNTHGQAFIICPLIDESETLTSVRAVTTEFERLKEVFKSLSLGLLHGRMKSQDKNATLDAFRKREIDVLVATPVVEVGIDIPNATIMVIEAADRFGLAALHQLRGRVGRGTLASYCLLFTEADNEMTLKRLKAMETIYSGPELAEVDLTLRGPGDLTGKRQHGLPALKIATLSDTKLIDSTRDALEWIMKEDPTLASLPHLRGRLKKGTIESQKAD